LSGAPATARHRVLHIGAAVVASALAYALYAQAAWPWVALGWVGLVPWLGVLDRTRSLRGAFAAGMAMAVAFEIAVFGWFALAIRDYTGLPMALGVGVLGLAGAALQPQFVTSALVRTWLRRARGTAPALTALATATTYVATEHYAPKLFGDTLGYCLYGSAWMRQGADIAGAPGLTLLMVLVNECVRGALSAFRLHRGRWTRAAVVPALTAVGLVVALLSYGAWRYAAFAPSGAVAALTVAAVQADLAHYDRMAEEIGRYATVRTVLDQHVALSAPAVARGDLALLVWPETVYPTTFGKPKSEDGAAFDREIAAFVAASGVPLIFGAYDTDGTEEYNAALFLAPDAGGPTAFATYRKTRLFPLTERVPAFLDSEPLRRALPWLGTWTPGSGPTVVPVRMRDGSTVRVAPLICYDVLDPELAYAAVRGGAELIVTLSNDSWFGFGPGPYLHQLGAAFRSIETRRPQIRATNTGVSAIIDATGALLATAGVDARTTLIAGVRPERHATTLVLRLGDWLGPWTLACAVVIVALDAWRRRA
jgi:apolipoprotein N-acyltransferase